MEDDKSRCRSAHCRNKFLSRGASRQDPFCSGAQRLTPLHRIWVVDQKQESRVRPTYVQHVRPRRLFIRIFDLQNDNIGRLLIRDLPSPQSPVRLRDYLKIRR